MWLDILRDKPEGQTIDVLLGLTCAALDIIGIAGEYLSFEHFPIGLVCSYILLGFGHEFHSLEGTDEDELAKAFMGVFNSNEERPSMIVALFMILRHRLGIVCEPRQCKDLVDKSHSPPNNHVK